MKVFISHSSDDKRFVRTLKMDLKENGIYTWVDEDELNFGDSLIEKLEQSIDDTSHFLIVLSESSVNSVWVQTELNHVLKTIDKRIIPIKYKECEAPEVLNGMIFGDVTAIIRTVEGDHLKFYGEAYHSFVEKLVNALRGAKSKLTRSEKVQLIQAPIQQAEKSTPNRYFNLKILGFKKESKEETIQKVRASLTAQAITALKENLTRPIILPMELRECYPKITLGTVIMIRNAANEKRKGVFAGFRSRADQTIVLPISIRNYLNLPVDQQSYNFVVSTEGYEMIVL